MGYTLGQAAKVSGVAKATLARALKSGKLSASRNPDGSFSIEPVELSRAFPPGTPGTRGAGRAMATLETTVETLVIQELRARLADKDAMLADLRSERDRLLTLVEQREQQRLPPPRSSWWSRWRRPL